VSAAGSLPLSHSLPHRPGQLGCQICFPQSPAPLGHPRCRVNPASIAPSLSRRATAAACVIYPGASFERALLLPFTAQHAHVISQHSTTRWVLPRHLAIPARTTGVRTKFCPINAVFKAPATIGHRRSIHCASTEHPTTPFGPRAWRIYKGEP
jgi:hypothetical protein